MEALAAQNELILEGRTDLIDVRDVAAQLRRAAAWGAQDAPAVDGPTAGFELEELEELLARQVPRDAPLGVTRRSTADVVAARAPLDHHARAPVLGSEGSR
jgi:hypothetical protein